jgi:hypothetical protein
MYGIIEYNEQGQTKLRLQKRALTLPHTEKSKKTGRQNIINYNIKRQKEKENNGIRQ